MLHRYMECRYDYERVASIKFFESESNGQILTVFETYKIENKQIDGTLCKISMNAEKEDRLYPTYRYNSKQSIIEKDHKILQEFLKKYFSSLSYNDFNVYYFPVSYRYSFRYDKVLKGYLDLHEDFINEKMTFYKLSFDRNVLPTETDTYTNNVTHDEIFTDFKNRLSNDIDIEKIEIIPTF